MPQRSAAHPMGRTVRGFRRHRVAYLFLLPNLLLFMVFTLVPFVWIFVLSFQSGSITGNLHWVGVRNYQRVGNDPLFWHAMANTLWYMVMVIPSVHILGLFLAQMFVQVRRGSSVLRAAVYFPQLSSVVVAAVVWIYILHPDYGPLAAVLGWFGVRSPNWLGNPDLALSTIAAVEFWRGVPFYILVFLAGLQGIPKELIEASRIDGAGRIRAFFSVTLPLMRPVLLFTIVMATIWNFQLFDSVFVMTRGGPANSTTTVVWFIYQNAFKFFNGLGKAATMSVILLFATFILSMAALRLMRGGDER